MLTHLIPPVIVVGSTNPVKINAVKTTLSTLTQKPLIILSYPAPSNVPEQPFSDAQTRQGAINRAFNALDHSPQAHWGIGLEGGVRTITYTNQKGRVIKEIVEVAWCAIVDKTGNIALGGGVEFQLPPAITKRLQKGEELGPIMDDLLNIPDVKKKIGAIGVLSNRLLTRQDIYQQLIKLALVKIISQHTQPNWWQNT